MTDPDDASRAVAEAAARDGYGRLLALLAAQSGDLVSAEDALADAFERALRTWPDDGTPGNPAGWLLTVARNRLRDRWRSAEVRRTEPLDPVAHAPVHLDALDAVDPDAVPDKRLELMLVCAHPAIAAPARTPLMLSTVLGFTAEQIARAWSVPTATMATRLVRAKRRVAQAGIPFVFPGREDLRTRTAAVLEAVYGAYAVEWSTTGPEPRGAPSEALQLAEVLADLLPDDPEVRGLAALVALSSARAAARLDPDGRFVPLDEQDPARWDRDLVERGRAHLRAAHGHRVLGRFQLEAAVQAVHCARIGPGPADPHTLRDLHEALHAVAPSLGSATALAVVTAGVEGPARGLALLDALLEPHGAAARRFQPAWAARAHLLAGLGRDREAVTAYDEAIALTHDAPQRAHLVRRRDEGRLS